MQLPGSKTLSQLPQLLSSQHWKQFQVYGVLPEHSIRLHLIGEAEHVKLSRGRIEIACSRGVFAVSQYAWQEYAGVWKTYTEPLIVQMIGPHRLALIAPGPETITIVLFGQEDDGIALEVFPGFSFGPVDLDAIFATPYQENAADRIVADPN